MPALITAIRFACALGGADCAAQEGTPPDSQALLKRARSAQEKFERTRRSYLPWVDPGWIDHCDEVNNGYCYTYGDAESSWKAPPEDKKVIQARDSLLALLQRTAQEIPGDRWTTGQRVRYLVEAGKLPEARRAAEACAATEAWWCSALAGYAAHAAEDFPAAEKAYDQALAAMEPPQRCVWKDITLLMPEAPASRYRQLGCETRDGLERRFWWIADPLYLTPGNERRSEHFSRFVYLEFEGQAPAVAPGRAWLNASEGWVVRYGRPAGWERERSRSLTMEMDPSIVTHFPEPSGVFEPGWEVLQHPESITPEARPLRYRDAKTGYAPTYTERFDSLTFQLSAFRRNGLFRLIGAYDLANDSVPHDAPTLAGLFLAPNDHEPVLAARSQQSAAGVITLSVPGRSGIVSLEAITLDGKRAGRARYWLPLAHPDTAIAGISDVMLLSRADSLPRNLEAALAIARTGTTVYEGAPVGLFWEVYGLGGTIAPVSLTVTLVKQGRSWLKRAAGSLGLGSNERPSVSVSWVVASNADGSPLAQSLALDLGKNDPGHYTLRIQASSQGRGTATTERDIVVTRE